MEGMGFSLLCVERSSLKGAGIGHCNLFDAGFGFAQFGLAVTLQKRTAFIGTDGVIKLSTAIFKLPDMLFKLGHGFLKAQLGNVGWQGRRWGSLCFRHGGTLRGAARKGKGGVDFQPLTPYSIHMIPMPTIIRSPKRKRTVALRVEADGSLVVQAPLRTSLSWIEGFIREKAGWIARRRKAQAEKQNRPSITLREGCLVPYLGIDHRLVLHLSVEESDAMPLITLNLPKDVLPECLHEEIKTELTLWYKKQARRVFAERMSYWAGRLAVVPTRLVITAPKRRWGSCSAKKNINLSFYVMLLPPHLVELILLHELCHTLEMNHSPRFWKELDRVTGGKAKLLTKELKSHHTW